MEIKDLKIGDSVRVKICERAFRDENDEVWNYEPEFRSGIVVSVDKYKKSAKVEFKGGNFTIIDSNSKWEKLPINRKIATHEDVVNQPSHYTYGDIEVIDYCDQVCKTYPPELAPYVFNAIKYVSRATHKNGKEDIAKAKYYVQRLFDKWEA